MTDLHPVRQLTVHRRLSNGVQVLVGQLAQNAQAVYFQYDADYLAHYQSLSPFMLPFTNQLSAAPKAPHMGLHGLFADSLPDGWGLLLMDRVFRQHGITPQQITAMDRLAYIGDRGMGALSYTPAAALDDTSADVMSDMATLGEHAIQLFDGQTEEVLTALANAGGSGGARPKALIYIDPDRPERVATVSQAGLRPWLIKFTSQNLMLGHDEGLCEAAYLTMAKNAGIQVPDWRLFASPHKAWLGLARFDCTEAGRYHMHTLCGLLDADFRQPSIDYEDLIKASQVLCQSPAVGRIQFIRAVFNLFAANQDDHSKNWSFLMDDDGKWRPAPFYDVTFSPNAHNQHTTAFMGYGNKPGLKAMQKLAAQANFSRWSDAQAEIEKVTHALSQWSTLARELGVSNSNIRLIGEQLNRLYQQNKELLS